MNLFGQCSHIPKKSLPVIIEEKITTHPFNTKYVVGTQNLKLLYSV